MKVSAINNQPHTARNKGRRIGSFVGLGAGSGYIIKNRKDIFINGIENTVKQLEASGKVISQPIVKGVKFAIPAVVIAAGILIGRTIGGLIGKAIDKHNAKKAPVRTADVEVTAIKGIVE